MTPTGHEAGPGSSGCHWMGAAVLVAANCSGLPTDCKTRAFGGMTDLGTEHQGLVSAGHGLDVVLGMGPDAETCAAEKTGDLAT